MPFHCYDGYWLKSERENQKGEKEKGRENFFIEKYLMDTKNLQKYVNSIHFSVVFSFFFSPSSLLGTNCSEEEKCFIQYFFIERKKMVEENANYPSMKKWEGKKDEEGERESGEDCILLEAIFSLPYLWYFLSSWGKYLHISSATSNFSYQKFPFTLFLLSSIQISSNRLELKITRLFQESE